MARRKRPDLDNPLRVQEILLRYKFDPLEEAVKKYFERITIPESCDAKVLQKMADRYDICEVDGKKIAKMKMADEVHLLEFITKYVYPQKRSAEPVNDNNMKLTIVLNTLQGEKPLETVELIDVKPKEIGS